MNNWVFVICFAIVNFGFIVRKRAIGDGLKITHMILCQLFAVLVVGAGFVFQEWIHDIVAPTDGRPGVLYDIATAPIASILGDAKTIALSGAVPGSFLAVLLLCTKAGAKWIPAGATGFLVLLTYDIIIVLINGYFRHQGIFLAGRTLALSVPCDFMGGIICGVFLRSSFLLINNKIEVAGNFTGPAAFIGLFGSGCLIALFVFFVFAYPLPERLDLQISEFERLSVRMGVFDAEVSPSDAPDLHFLSGVAHVYGELSQTDIILKNDSRLSIPASIVGLVGCKDAQSAIVSAKQYSGRPYVIFPGKGTISLGFFKSQVDLNIGQKQPPAMFLSFKNAYDINIYPSPVGRGRVYVFGPQTYLDNAVTLDDPLVVSDTPLSHPSFANIINGAILRPVVSDDNFPMRDCLQKSSDPLPREWFVIEADQNSIRAIVELANQNTILPNSFGLESSGAEDMHLFGVTGRIAGILDVATLTVGAAQHAIDPGAEITATASAFFATHELPSGAVQFQGQATYIELNGTRLNSTVFESFSGVIQGGILSLIGFILAALFHRAIRKGFIKIYGS